MATVAEPVVAQANGAASSSPRPSSPLSAASTSAKRKREVSDDGSEDEEMTSSQVADDDAEEIDERELIRDYFVVLQSHDNGTNLLKRPLPDDLAANDSKSKRQKSSEPIESVAQKIENEEYGALDDVLRDIKRAVRSRLNELQEDEDDDHTQANNEAISQALRFEATAEEMFNRESSYPNDKDRWREPVKSEFRDSLPSAALGHQVLTVWGMGSRAMPFFSSVPHPPGGGPAKPISEKGLPNGVTLTRIMTPPNSKEKSSSHPLTLGELFPSPRNLPPLQPPKVAKTSTKGNVLKFYHPDPSEKSRYRNNTYSSHDITAGHYLDYSNAAPSSQIKTRQRERAQSLAGHKPSSTELVNTETEALFRGAFSSFAPVRDDTGAIVSAGQAGRLWWNKVGHRALERMIEAEMPDDESDVATTAPITPVVESMALDDVLIKDTLDNWDDIAIDPSLQDVMPKKPAADKELDEVLDEVSDLIETLASFQWNRNLTLPTSQDRQSIDPINGDMLRNASSAHQPSEDETLTYKTLQSQLALIIQGLPPYAVARLNSDKLAELSVSTKIPVHMDEYRGAIEEDEASRARPQQPAVSQTVPTPAPRPVSRTPSMSGLQYTSQYGAQYSASRPPMPSSQGYAHTPGRPAPTNMYGSRPASNVPVPMQYRPTPTGQSSRPAQPYTPGYGSQLARTPGAYGQNSMAGYPTGSPGQQQRPGYPQGSTPGSAYAANYRAGQPPARPAGGYPFANGTPIRNATPQSGYYGASQQQAGHASYGAGSGTPQSQQRAQDQIQAPARATAAEVPRRFAAQLSATSASPQQQPPRPTAGAVSGLSALGIQTGNIDMMKLAAARARNTALGLSAASGTPSPATSQTMASGLGQARPVNGDAPSTSPVAVSGPGQPPSAS